MITFASGGGKLPEAQPQEARSMVCSVARGLALIGAVILACARPVMAQQMPTMQLGMMPMQPETRALFARLLPSVVTIHVRKEAAQTAPGMNAAGSEPEGTRVFGSGFVIDPSGVIATNEHVVHGAWQIEVTFADGTQVPAHVLDVARLIDVALIKVDAGHELPAVQWGDSSTLQIGDPVFAVGNALGVGISVSGGIVSGLNRDIMDSPYDDYIQTDAAINHGNSGGPLFNTKGEVVGIDTAIISPTSGWSGIGFAIPSRAARMVTDRLMNPNAPRPGWIGIKLQPVTPEVADALGMKQARGSIVGSLAQDGPAVAAGLRVGDIVLYQRVGDIVLHQADTPPTDQRALLRAITATPIGQTISFVVWRDGTEQTVDIPVKEWPRRQWDALDMQAAGQPHHGVPPDLGLALAPADDANRARFGLMMNQAGVVVTGVAANSDAAERGLAAGDVILRVQDKPVSTAAEAQSAFAAARADKRRFVLVLLAPRPHDKAGSTWVTLLVAED
jgi:serine protease Do